MALAIASLRTQVHGPPRHIYQDKYPDYNHKADDCLAHINYKAELLEVASVLSSQELDAIERGKWVLLRAFLWTNWQRLVMLWLHFQLDKHLRERRYRHHKQYTLQVRTTFPTPGVSSDEFGKNPSYRDKYPNIPYMCRWSFILLRTQPALATGDHRASLHRYASLFAGKHQRCNPIRAEALCDGVHPERYQRFIGIQVVDQSGHNNACDRNIIGCCRRRTCSRHFNHQKR